jgi:hypothetical protein
VPHSKSNELKPQMQAAVGSARARCPSPRSLTPAYVVSPACLRARREDDVLKKSFGYGVGVGVPADVHYDVYGCGCGAVEK